MFPWIKKRIPPEARTFIAYTFSIMVVFGLCYYITHAEDKNAYAVCTIKSHKIEAIGGQASNYTVESPKGIFETDECGTLEMYGTSDGKKIPEYVSAIHDGKKYKVYKSATDKNKDKDFGIVRLEEIKE